MGKKSGSERSELKQSMKGKLQDVFGDIIGPDCMICGKMIDVRSSRQNGNVTQGWTHEECLPYAEKAERDAAEVEPVYEEKELS